MNLAGKDRPARWKCVRYGHHQEVEKLSFDLPTSERAILAAHLFRSLPSVLYDKDEGVGEALRRDAELDADPAVGMTLDQLDRDRRTSSAPSLPKTEKTNDQGRSPFCFDFV